MALDVHLIAPGGHCPEPGSYTRFGFEDEHEGVFALIAASDPAYCYLSRLKDPYTDVVYEPAELPELLPELDHALALCAPGSPSAQALRRFRELCVDASDTGKAILLFGD